jgi:hypothetical protein
MNKQSNHIWKLGMFVIGALVVFAATIFFIGKQKIFWINLRIQANFKNKWVDLGTTYVFQVLTLVQ